MIKICKLRSTHSFVFYQCFKVNIKNSPNSYHDLLSWFPSNARLKRLHGIYSTEGVRRVVSIHRKIRAVFDWLIIPWQFLMCQRNVKTPIGTPLMSRSQQSARHQKEFRFVNTKFWSRDFQFAVKSRHFLEFSLFLIVNSKILMFIDFKLHFVYSNFLQSLMEYM